MQSHVADPFALMWVQFEIFHHEVFIAQAQEEMTGCFKVH